MALRIIVLLGFVALGVVARPQAPPSSLQQHPATQNGTVATILSNEFTNNGDGTFRWEVETSDGFKAEQSGFSITQAPGAARSGVNGTSDDEGGESVKGSYSYKAPNGQLISVSYIADQNGFQPIGSHIPSPPPNPFSNPASAAGATHFSNH